MFQILIHHIKPMLMVCLLKNLNMSCCVVFFFGKIVFIFLNLLLHNVKIIKRFFFFTSKHSEKSRDKCL